jgi:hypothetical protein
LTLSVDEQANWTDFLDDNEASGDDIGSGLRGASIKFIDAVLSSASSVPVKEGRASNDNEEAETCKDSVDIDRAWQSCCGNAPTFVPPNEEWALSAHTLGSVFDGETVGVTVKRILIGAISLHILFEFVACGYTKRHGVLIWRSKLLRLDTSNVDERCQQQQFCVLCKYSMYIP